MGYTHYHNTEAEAIAFVNGVNLVGDIDVTTSDIFQDEKGWGVIVSVGDDGDDED